jgi:hypothetical protein
MSRLLRSLLTVLSAAAGGGTRISRKDVERAIQDARERVGPEFAELLTAPTMTEEEMDEAEEKARPEEIEE